MQATVMREHLREGLQVVERVVGRTPSLPVLQNVLLSLRKNKIRLAGTDLQVAVTCEFLANTKGEEEVVFAPKFVTPLLSIVEENQISLGGDERQMVLDAGNFHTVVQTGSAEEFPIIPSLKEEDFFCEISADILCEGLNKVVGMVGQSQARPEIGGVLFVFEKELLRLVATDSFRLAEKKLVLESRNTTEQNFILPQKTAKELVGILGERQGKTKVYLSPAQVIFDYTTDQEPPLLHIQIVSRLIEGEYPSYQDVIPKEHKTKVVFLKENFVNHVRAASVFSGKSNEITLSADPAKKGISFLGQNTEAGETRSFLGAEVIGQKVDIAFNWRFLLEGLTQMKASRVELDLSGEDGPALLRAGDQEGYLYVIMPIKA